MQQLSTNQVIISSVSSHAAPQGQILWKRAADDLYVATMDGEFAGFVSVADDRYTLHGPCAQALGVHESLKDASVVLEFELVASGERLAGSHT